MPNANPTTTETETAAPRKGGRVAGKPTRPSDEVAIENLEEATSRLLWYLEANPTSAFTILLARCARAGVSRERAEKALVMVEEAAQSARVAMTAAYERPVKTDAPAQRPKVSL